MNSQKTQGFFLLLIFVWLGTFLLNGEFASEYNSRNVIRYCSMFGIIGIGVMFVIVTGGIDLSIGSAIGLIGGSLVLLMKLNPVESLLPLRETEQQKVVWFFWSLAALMPLSSFVWIVQKCLEKNFRFKKLWLPLAFFAMGVVGYFSFSIANSSADNAARIPAIFFLLFTISVYIGLLHGVLITHFELQPFVVTLGGLLCYRGLIRWLTNDTTQGLSSTFDESLRVLARGEICSVATLMLFCGILIFLLSLFKLVKARGQKESSQREPLLRNAIVGIVIGVVLFVVGVSRFTTGFERTDFQTLFDLSQFGIPISFSTWTTEITGVDQDESILTRPRMLMGYCLFPLIIVFLATVAALIKSILSAKAIGNGAGEESTGAETNSFSNSRAIFDFFWINEEHQKNGFWFMIVTLSGLLVSGILLYVSILNVSGTMVFSESENAQWWIQKFTIFSSLAIVMVSISRFGKCVALHGNFFAKLGYPIAGILGVLTVFGQTDVATTPVQTPFFIAVALAIFAIIIFDKTVFGRYLLAIGNNESAAKYSGIDTRQVTIMAYVICSGIVCIAAVIFMLDFNSVAPTGFGSFYELYAIAAVVLGGCSLRGGEANILGVLLGAAIMRVLANAPDMIDFPKTLEYAILGLVILVGVIVDDRIRRQAAKKALEANLVSMPEKA